MELFTNASVLTMAESTPSVGRNVLVDRGRVVAVGGGNLLTVDAVRHDLGGRWVVPGFIDSHVHLMSTFLAVNALILDRATSVNDVLERLREYAETHDQQIIFGRRLSEFSLAERRLPTRAELDWVVPDRPVVLNSVEFHTLVLNSAAFDLVGVPLTRAGFEKDPAGHFTGTLRGTAAALTIKRIYALMGDDVIMAGRDATMAAALARGVTTLMAVEGGAMFERRHAELVAEQRHSFPIDVELFYSVTDVREALRLGLPRIGGDVFLDGSFRSHNAALDEPYRDRPGDRGSLHFSRTELTEFVEDAHVLGLQVAIHAVGPRAIERTLDAYASVLARHPAGDHRHRIEHFELPRPEQIDRAAELGIVLAVHPLYEHFYREPGDMYDVRLGPERALRTNPLRQLLDAGVPLAGCSDSDVLPLDPLLGMHAAVNHRNPASRITPYEALRLFTSGSAFGMFAERQKGVLAPGRAADFVVLGDDPLACAPERLKDVPVLATYKDGRRLYAADEFDDQPPPESVRPG